MSYQPLKGVGFLLQRLDSISTHPERSLPTMETSLRATSGRMGYGGLDLQKRRFWLPYPYWDRVANKGDINNPLSSHPLKGLEFPLIMLI
ncbi:MAG: hypothetical protein ACUVQ5_02390 [Candidatus Methanomethylicaceae archaeon]